MGHTASLLLFLIIFAMPGSAQAWVRGYQPFPQGEATVILHRFCQKAQCGPFTQQQWRQMIQRAVEQWNAAGANFTFHTRPVQPADDPCHLAPGEVAVLLSAYGRECPGDPSHFLDMPDISKGFAVFWPNGGRVYMQQPHDTQLAPLYALEFQIMYTLVHELGHLVGLDHPNDVGQRVEAVMNGQGWGRMHDTLQPDDIAGIRALYPTQAAITGVLENPAPSAVVSGIGFLSGWKCGAQDITVQIDARPPMAVAMGMTREDTRSTCGGETENGFIIQTNWNWLGEGEHTAVAYDSGVEFARSTFTVGTTGEEFLKGLTVSVDVPNFPAPDETGRFVWNESTQHLELAEVIPAAPTTGSACSTLRGLSAVDYYGAPGRWDITNPCTPWQGHPHVLHIDVTPLSQRFELDTEAIVITQGGRRVDFDSHIAWIEWRDRHTQRDLDAEYLYQRTETTLIIHPEAGLDLRRPFSLSYTGQAVVAFE